jgi:hypothetical protein
MAPAVHDAIHALRDIRDAATSRPAAEFPPNIGPQVLLALEQFK